MKQLAILSVLLPLHMAVAEPAKPVELIAGDVLSNFQEVKNWNCVGEAKAVPDQTKLECSGEGGVLVNVTKKKKRAPYLFTKEEFRDVEVHIEFTVPKGANSGVYLMGRYEIQVFDSFGDVCKGLKWMKSADTGTIIFGFLQHIE